MQPVLGLAVLVPTALLLCWTGVVVPASDAGWPPPADGSVDAGGPAGDGLTADGHSPAVNADELQTSLSRRRRRRRLKHHHHQQQQQQHGSTVRVVRDR